MGELYHYGVKGMKWGVRKSPERSGTRKEKRHVKKQQRIQKRHDKALSVKSSARYTYRQRKLLSDDELRYRVNRLNMERQLKDLSRNTNSFNPVSSGYNELIKPGKQAAGKALSLYGAKVLVTSTVGPEAGAFIRPKK